MSSLDASLIDSLHRFTHAAILYDQHGLPAVDRFVYQQNYRDNREYFEHVLEMAAKKARGCSSIPRFKLMHILDGPLQQRSAIPISTIYKLSEEFITARSFDDVEAPTPSRRITDLQLLRCQVRTNFGYFMSPVIVIYPGEGNNINTETLTSFFNRTIGYCTQLTELPFNHPIRQHKTKTPVTDWMTGVTKNSIYAVHLKGFNLSDRYEDYSTTSFGGQRLIETNHRKEYYQRYERLILESLMKTHYDSDNW